MPEFEVQTTVEFEVYCGKCGAGLCNQTSTENRRGTNRVTVDPCEKCLDEAEATGFDKGKAEAAEEARQEGMDRDLVT